MQPESFNVHFTIASEVLQALTGSVTALAALSYLFVGGCVSGLLMRHFTSQPMSLWRWPEKLAAGTMTALWPAAVPGVPLWFLAATAWRTAKAPAAAGVRLAYGNGRREAEEVRKLDAKWNGILNAKRAAKIHDAKVEVDWDGGETSWVAQSPPQPNDEQRTDKI